MFDKPGLILKIKEIIIFPDFPNAVGVFGLSGTGKSFWLQWALEYFYTGDHKHYIPTHKIIDIYDEGRLENCFIFFPRDIDGGRGLPTECFIPACPEMPRRLPEIFKPFRICFSDLDLIEFLILLGKVSEVQRSIIELAWTLSKDLSFMEFVELIKDFSADTKLRIGEKIVNICDEKTGIQLIQKLDKLYRSGIIGDKNDPLNLDLDAIMRDRKTVTCFSMAFLPDQNVRHLIYAYLLRAIYTLRISQKYRLYPPLAIGHREIHNNAPARGKKSSFAYQGQGLSLEMLKKIGAEPRDVNIRLIGDSQDPLKIDSDVRKCFTTKIIFHLDRAQIDALGSQFWLPEGVKIGIQKAGKGVCAVKGRPEPSNPYNKYGVQFPLRFPDPLSRTKSPDDLFFKIWKDAGLPFKTWKIKDPVSLLEIRKLKKDERKEVMDFKTASIYDFFGSILCKVIRENPGVSYQDVLDIVSSDDPYRDLGLGWDKNRIARIAERAEGKGLIVRARSGRSWALYLPDDRPVVGE